MFKNTLIGILLLVSIFLAFDVYQNRTNNNEHDSVITSVNDGPYIFYDNNKLEASWLCQGEVSKISVPLTAIPNYLSKVEKSDLDDLSETLTYQGDYKVAALSDLHGQYDLMMKLLTNNKIIDQKGDWNFDNGHFVITGDVFDRGDKVTEILWFLFKLEQQAEMAGGQLHLLLGNHEVMILNDNLRYLNPKYKSTAQVLNKSYPELFSNNSVIGNWIRKKPVMVKVNNMLFAHGGFHPDLVKDNHDMAEINQVFKENLIEVELDKPREGFGKFLHERNGPIWYRGYFKENGATTEDIYSILKHFDVDFLIVGHTSQETIETRYQGKVIAIDSSIKAGEYGEILFIDGDKKWRGSLSGEALELN